MLEERQEKGMNDTTVLIRKGQLHKVKNEIRNGGDPCRVGAQNRNMYILTLALVQIYVLFTPILILLLINGRNF